ncbi:hypothetical protein [Hydrogenophaga sp.]|uniref:hypothetical protein n=1 Tax=Hydrogenophaga sp. TaxID=1904254 RepID=UPI003F704DED
MLQFAGWLLIILAGAIFITGMVGMLRPQAFSNGAQADAAPRWMFALAAWLLPPWPAAVGFLLLHLA